MKLLKMVKIVLVWLWCVGVLFLSSCIGRLATNRRTNQVTNHKPGETEKRNQKKRKTCAPGFIPYLWYLGAFGYPKAGILSLHAFLSGFLFSSLRSEAIQRRGKKPKKMKNFENARTWRVKGSNTTFRPIKGWPNTTERTVVNYGQLFFSEKEKLYYTEGEYRNGSYTRKYYKPENIEFR